MELYCGKEDIFMIWILICIWFTEPARSVRQYIERDTIVHVLY